MSRLRASYLLAPFLLSALLGQTPSPTLPPGQAPVEDARALMLQARALQRRGGGNDPAAAAAVYRKVIHLQPRSSEAFLRLSEALAESGDLEGAMTAARKAVDLNPRGTEALANLGILAYRRAPSGPEAQAEAKAILLKATRLLPSDPELWARLGEVAELQKDPDLAMRAFLKLGRLRPQILGAWERVLVHAKTLNRYEPRREGILALAQNQPHGPDARSLRMLEDLAKEQVQSGFLAHAEESFRMLGRLLPEHRPAILENISHVQVQAGRFEEAQATLQQAIALRSTPRNRFNLAVCRLYLGQASQAETLLRELLPDLNNGPDQKPTADAGRILLATTLAVQDRPKDLLSLLSTWPDTPRQAELAALKFQSLVRLENWKGARQELKLGMARFEKHSLFQTGKNLPPKALEEGLFGRKAARGILVQLAQEHRAAVLAEFRQWEASLAATRMATAAYPGRKATLLLMESNALDQLGRYPEAIQVLREAQRSEPDNAILQNNLGYLLLERGGELEEAARLIESAVKKEPESSSVQDSWGWVLFRQGKYEDSEKALRKASELNPFSPEVRKHLGDTLLKLGREEEALEQWERALAFAFQDRPALQKRYTDLEVARAKRAQAAEAEPTPAPDKAADAEEGEDEP